MSGIFVPGREKKISDRTPKYQGQNICNYLPQEGSSWKNPNFIYVLSVLSVTYTVFIYLFLVPSFNIEQVADILCLHGGAKYHYKSRAPWFEATGTTLFL